MNDPHFVTIPKILETPKGEDMKEDKINLRTLKKLVRRDS
jgi:deoxyribonuclease-4